MKHWHRAALSHADHLSVARNSEYTLSCWQIAASTALEKWFRCPRFSSKQHQDFLKNYYHPRRKLLLPMLQQCHIPFRSTGCFYLPSPWVAAWSLAFCCSAISPYLLSGQHWNTLLGLDISQHLWVPAAKGVKIETITESAKLVN